MKAFRYLGAAAVFCAAAAVLFAAEDPLSRQRMVDSARNETALLSYAASSADSLGDWKETIDAVLFLLLRKTELDRGSIRVLVSDALEYPARWYPDGTFAVSTELLDYIDYTIFDRASSSGRRIRNIDDERETLLAPFLAYEAARLACDTCYASWQRNASDESFNSRTSEDFDETSAADRYSYVLLSLAGFDPALLTRWIEALADPESFSQFDRLESWRAELPDATTRLLYASREASSLAALADEISGALQALASGTGLSETLSNLAELVPVYPGNLHIAELSAFVAYRNWLSTAPADELKLLPFLPWAKETDPLAERFASVLDIPVSQHQASQGVAALLPGMPVSVPGNNADYIRAVKLFEACLAVRASDALVSAYATLLVWSADPALRRQALELSRTAAIRESEEGSADYTARANHAQILFLTGTDYPEAHTMMANIRTNADSVPLTGRALPGFLSRGMTGDTRDIVLSLALMSHALNSPEQARKLAEERMNFLPAVPDSPDSPNDGRTLSFRGLQLGDTTDVLTALWGKPAFINYTWYTENWQYPGLGASVLIGSASGEQTVDLIRVFGNSVLSPILQASESEETDFPHIRTGDSQSDFEKAFGKSVWRSGDCEVYAAGKVTIAVLYLDGKIRRMSARSAH